EHDTVPALQLPDRRLERPPGRVVGAPVRVHAGLRAEGRVEVVRGGEHRPGQEGRSGYRVGQTGADHSRTVACHSGFVSRLISAVTATRGLTPSWQTRSTCSVIGISTSHRRARSRIARQLFTPSAVCRVAACACSSVSPRPRCSPKVRLRDSGEQHVATRSPRPASPEKVSGSAPRRTPSRAVSARPRVIRVALVLSPKPSACAIPYASAITFFTAPPSSQPTTSSLVYGRKYRVVTAFCTTAARTGSVHATTEA